MTRPDRWPATLPWHEELADRAGTSAESIVDYVLDGADPGSFLYAVLTNDLKEACARADLENQRRLFDIMNFLYNCCPSGCFGSVAKVNYWLERKAAAL